MAFTSSTGSDLFLLKQIVQEGTEGTMTPFSSSWSLSVFVFWEDFWKRGKSGVGGRYLTNTKVIQMNTKGTRFFLPLIGGINPK